MLRIKRELLHLMIYLLHGLPSNYHIFTHLTISMSLCHIGGILALMVYHWSAMGIPLTSVNININPYLPWVFGENMVC